MKRWNRWSVVAGIFAAMAVALPGEVGGDTLWTEGAENGLADVIDGTTGGYNLIQSSIVGKGNNAFHLANPNFLDNSFVLDQTLTIQADTKLFFLSRLRNSTSAQVARVQISTNGGSTWPTNIYNQPGSGSGSGGEGTFSLKEVDLSSYVNQSVRFRFLYDFTSGSAFTGVTSSDGWFVDDIQIGSEIAKLPWSIGNPSPHAQLYLEYINRARADALVEAARLANETDPNIQGAYNFFGIDEPNIVNQFTWYVNNGHMARHAQPLSFHDKLQTAAQLHSQDMYNNQFQGHNSSANPPAPLSPGMSPTQRANAVGYNSPVGENVFAYANSVAVGHAGFDVDWGNLNTPGAPAYNPAFVGQGMQNPAGHRRNLHRADYKEIGIGVVNGTNGSVGPQIVTEDFGLAGDIRYITGVVYQDLNSNSFYDIGEGRSGVRIDVDGSVYYALSSTSGGYSVPVPQNGTYEVTFSGGGYASYLTTVTVAGGESEKVDYLAIVGLDGDFNHDNVVDAADFTVWRDGLGSMYTINDYNLWKSNFGDSLGSGSSGAAADGGAVPEPTSCGLMLVGLALLFHRRARVVR